MPDVRNNIAVDPCTREGNTALKRSMIISSNVDASSTVNIASRIARNEKGDFEHAFLEQMSLTAAIMLISLNPSAVDPPHQPTPTSRDFRYIPSTRFQYRSCISMALWTPCLAHPPATAEQLRIACRDQHWQVSLLLCFVSASLRNHTCDTVSQSHRLWIATERLHPRVVRRADLIEN